MAVEKVAENRRCFVSRVVVKFHGGGFAILRRNPSGDYPTRPFLVCHRVPDFRSVGPNSFFPGCAEDALPTFQL